MPDEAPVTSAVRPAGTAFRAMAMLLDAAARWAALCVGAHAVAAMLRCIATPPELPP
jgi:uncharacterized RDD family membrane protein YckC